MTNSKQPKCGSREGEGEFQSVGALIRPLLQQVAAIEGILLGEEIMPKDVGYTHPVFLQCFLPTRHTEKNKLRWQTNCGRASLVIRAGELIKPGKPGIYKQCTVPAGPKARFVIAYINDSIQRDKTRTVNLGGSLRKAMEELKIPTSGQNGKALQREIENFAAAEISLGVWEQDGSARQHRALVAEDMTFWLDKNPDQHTIWQQEMTVSQRYFDAIRDGDRLTPFYWPAIIALSDDTRAMDIHCFLVYRLHRGLKRDVSLSALQLHALFGQDVVQLDHFWPRFVASLKRALKWYPEARIEVRNDCIVLKNSPPLIPHRKLARIK